MRFLQIHAVKILASGCDTRSLKQCLLIVDDPLSLHEHDGRPAGPSKVFGQNTLTFGIPVSPSTNYEL